VTNGTAKRPSFPIGTLALGDRMLCKQCPSHVRHHGRGDPCAPWATAHYCTFITNQICGQVAYFGERSWLTFQRALTLTDLPVCSARRDPPLLRRHTAGVGHDSARQYKVAWRRGHACSTCLRRGSCWSCHPARAYAGRAAHVLQRQSALHSLHTVCTSATCTERQECGFLKTRFLTDGWAPDELHSALSRVDMFRC
jgi:hypothetical protein